MKINNEKLRALRLEKVLSWTLLARKAGVSPATLYSLNSGKRNSSELTVQKLANALGVDPRELVKGE